MTAPLTNPARSSLRGSPARRLLPLAGQAPEPRPRRVMRALPVGTGAASVAPLFPLFGLRLTGAILSAATNHNARRGSGRAGDLHHDLRVTCATARDNRAALDQSGAVAGSCDPARARGNPIYVIKLAGASVPAFFNGGTG